ncbi:MAG: hypothetical protein ACP5T5_02110 [Thermoprotei archaeon]
MTMKSARVLLLVLVALSVYQNPVLAQQPMQLIPSMSPIYVGLSSMPIAFTYYFYLVNPSPYSAYASPSFYASPGVRLQARVDGVDVPAFSAVEVPLVVNVTGSGTLYVNYSLNGRKGTLYIQRVPLLVDAELVSISSRTVFPALAGQQVPLNVVISSFGPTLTLEENNASLLESGDELSGDFSVPSGLPSSVLEEGIEVTCSVRGKLLSISVPVIVTVEGYSGDGFPMSMNYLGKVTSMKGAVEFAHKGPLALTLAVSSNTTDYLVLNFTRAPSEFWVALNRSDPVNFTYANGKLSGPMGKVEGWTHEGTVFFLAFNETAAMSWEVGANGTSTGWLPPPKESASISLKGDVLYALVGVVALACAVVVFWALNRRKKGWPYSWD